MSASQPKVNHYRADHTGLPLQRDGFPYHLVKTVTVNIKINHICNK